MLIWWMSTEERQSNFDMPTDVGQHVCTDVNDSGEKWQQQSSQTFQPKAAGSRIEWTKMSHITFLSQLHFNSTKGDQSQQIIYFIYGFYICEDYKILPSFAATPFSTF